MDPGKAHDPRCRPVALDYGGFGDVVHVGIPRSVDIEDTAENFGSRKQHLGRIVDDTKPIGEIDQPGATLERCLGFQIATDQFREELERRADGRIAWTGRCRVQRAQRPEERPPAQDRRRDVALETVSLRRMMVTIYRIVRHMIDRYGASARTDLVTKRGPDVQFTPRLQPEGDLVVNRTGDPSVGGNARNRCETHPCQPAGSFQDLVDRPEPAHGGGIV